MVGTVLTAACAACVTVTVGRLWLIAPSDAVLADKPVELTAWESDDCATPCTADGCVIVTVEGMAWNIT